jgi:hypothetical protein
MERAHSALIVRATVLTGEVQLIFASATLGRPARISSQFALGLIGDTRLS